MFEKKVTEEEFEAHKIVVFDAIDQLDVKNLARRVFDLEHKNAALSAEKSLPDLFNRVTSVEEDTVLLRDRIDELAAKDLDIGGRLQDIECGMAREKLAEFKYEELMASGATISPKRKKRPASKKKPS